jgi:hypothetical protein
VFVRLHARFYCIYFSAHHPVLNLALKHSVVFIVTQDCCGMFASKCVVKIGSEVDPIRDTKSSPKMILGGVEGGEILIRCSKDCSQNRR